MLALWGTLTRVAASTILFDGSKREVLATVKTRGQIICDGEMEHI